MNRLENISDQLHGYAQEAADTICKIAKEYNMSKELSAAAVGIAAVAQLTDVFYHIEGHLGDMNLYD